MSNFIVGIGQVSEALKQQQAAQQNQLLQEAMSAEPDEEQSKGIDLAPVKNKIKDLISKTASTSGITGTGAEAAEVLSDAQIKDYVLRAVMEDGVMHNLAKLMMLDNMSMNSLQRTEAIRNRWNR